MKRKLLIGLAFIVSLCALGTGTSYASNGGYGFSVTPLDDSNEGVKEGYYDLVVKPNDQKKLKVKISNGSDDDMKIKVELNDATTNDNGITAYDATDKKDSTLKTGFSEIATIKEDEVVVKKNSSTVVDINVAIPKEKYDGVILGGLRFSDAEAKKKAKEAKSAVTNNISYVIGVMLRETDKEIKPQIALNRVGANQRNYRNYISANIQNTQPILIGELTAHAKVTKKGESKVLYEASKNDMRMAPNSNFNFGISLESQPLIPGKYTMMISGESDGIPYDFTKDFEIEKKAARELNENSVFVKQEPNIWLYFCIALGIFGVIGLIIYLIYRNRDTKKAL